LYLHTIFLQYHRSGQSDSETDKWGSETEYKHWVHAAQWKTAGSNSYSIAVLDLCGLEYIGRKIPKGMGVDATVNDGTLAPRHKSKKQRATKKHNAAIKSQKCIVSAIEKADAHESKMAAL